MKTINDLQELINERAKNKLDNDINVYLNYIRSNPLFKGIGKLSIGNDEDKCILSDFFYNNFYEKKIREDKIV